MGYLWGPNLELALIFTMQRNLVWVRSLMLAMLCSKRDGGREE